MALRTITRNGAPDSPLSSAMAGPFPVTRSKTRCSVSLRAAIAVSPMTALHRGGEVTRYITCHGTKRVAKAVLIVSTAAEDIVPTIICSSSASKARSRCYPARTCRSQRWRLASASKLRRTSRPSSNALRGKARRAGGVLSGANANFPTSLCTPKRSCTALPKDGVTDQFNPGVCGISIGALPSSDMHTGPD
jgi:hypothetical protein